MKLYTEEQVKEIYFKGVHNGRLHIEGKCSDEVESLTPIELPSDEEIEASKFPLNSPEQELWNGGYEEGAKWIRNKIQGDDKQ
jgi:hypothetical protein